MPLHLRNNTRVQAGYSSSQGVKSSNDDCVGVRIPEEPLLTTKGVVVVVADGVSVAEKGKDAAEICVQGFLNDYYDTPDAWTVATASQRVLTALNRWLFTLGQGFSNPNKGFVTTLSILVLKGNTAHIFHVGDSRVGRLRDGRMELLTRDHTARLSDSHRQLTRAVGLDVNLDVDYRREEVNEGDLFCLSTDGLHEFVSDEQMVRVLQAEAADLTAGAEQLNQLALDHGSTDNVSSLLLRVDGLSKLSEEEVFRQVSRLPFPPELYPGMTMDGYRVERDVKSSSRSQVFLVRDIESDERFIMKTPSVNFEDDTAYLERFAMESWIAKRVGSPHVAGLANSPRPQRFLYNLYEHIEGPTLAEWIAQNPKPEVKLVRSLAEQIVTGLRIMHRKEMLHQDLKPENIVVHPERGAVIIDMGSCYVAGIAEIDTEFQRDQILGTMQFSAPEYRLGRKPTRKADLFSLGVIIYKMFTGHYPYGDAYSKAQSVRDFSRLNYEPAYVHNPLVPVWVDGVLRKAVQVNSESRYDSFSELLYDLEHPNEEFLLQGKLPFIQRGSTDFWRTAAIIFFLAEVLTLGWFLLNGS